MSGTIQDGTWQVSITLPKYAEAGIWKVQYVYLHDVTGNLTYLNMAGLQSSGFPTTFTVTSSPADTLPPQIKSLTFTPNFVDTTAGAKQITVTQGATDNLAGVDATFNFQQSPNLNNYPYLFFQSPSGGQTLYIFPTTFLAGTPKNGTWQGIGNLPQYGEAGTWMLVYAQLADAAANVATYSNAQLNALGFPTRFDLGFDPLTLSANSIIEGPFLLTGGATLFIDGTIDDAAGTISDTANALNGSAAGVSGDGVLATVSFTALAKGSSTITLFNTILLDSQGSDIALDGLQNGSVTVNSGTTVAVPEPSAFALMGIALVATGFRPRRRRDQH